MKYAGIEESKFNILWVGGLAVWLAIVAYDRVSTGEQSARAAPLEISGPVSYAGPLTAPLGSGRAGRSQIYAPSPGAPAALESAAVAGATEFSIYLHLHETRDLAVDPLSREANACTQ